MNYIAHRINTVAELLLTPIEYGVELDIRDNIDGTLFLNHDPFVIGESFEQYLSKYNHGTLICNVKSERVELKTLKLLNKYNINNYFFLDSSFPMIKLLSDKGINNIALRFSEFERVDTIINMAGKAQWIWVDCFTVFPLTRDIYVKFKSLNYKICVVSPELQGQPENIEKYAQIIREESILPDAICTKFYNINTWKAILGENNEQV
jgi:hypothetical protein